MHADIEYSATERALLWTLAAFGFFVVNGLFLYGLLARPEAVAEAMANPIALAFQLEAYALLITLAYLLARWRATRLSWGWFVALSIVGSLAFALPVAILWKRNHGEAGP